jgi:hypothetical protein
MSLPKRDRRLNSMNARKQPNFEAPAGFVDPRSGPDFEPESWPLCNGASAPALDTSDPNERRCIEFLAHYYKLNLLNRRLLAARKSKKSPATVRSILSRIAKATAALEKLEDRYAPIGFYGEPVMDGILYRDITFVRPALPRIFPELHSSHIAIPGLEDIPSSELRGPVNIVRFGHGKVDL